MPPSAGDPLAKSVAQANLKSQTPLPPDEEVVKAVHGDQGLREYRQHKADAKLRPEERAIKASWGEAGLSSYREMKKEFVEARQLYMKTGQMPPLKHHAPIEIMTGKPMTRAERYDANLTRQGKSASYPRMDVEADPSYLSRDEFREEWVSRGAKEMQACDDNYIRPGKKEKCRIAVKEKYMGKEYMEDSWAATAAVWNNGAYIEKIKNSGPIGLGGRLIGRGVGYAIDGKEGADKGEEIGGLIGDVGDVGVAVKSGGNARARVRTYEGSAGLEVRREPPVQVVNRQSPAPAGTQPDVPSVGSAATKAPNETFLLSYGADNPGFKQMGGLGAGRIRVDHSPGARQDFGQGFYVAVGQGKQDSTSWTRPGLGNGRNGVEIAEAFGDIRVAQRKSGPRQVLAWEVKRSDLGDVVDVRPGGEHEAAWRRYLEQPLAPNVKMTIGDHIRGVGVEQRGAYFERFLQSIGKQNADAVIGPIGTPETAGVVSEPGTQMVVRSQRAADRLNQIMGGTSGPIGPTGQPTPSTRAMARLQSTAQDLQDKNPVRTIEVLTQPGTFRHTITGDIPGVNYARIEQEGSMRLSTGVKAHYGEGVYAWHAGQTGVGTYVDIQVPAGTAVETIKVGGQSWVRMVPPDGNVLPVKIVGTNIPEAQINFGRQLLTPEK